MITSALRTIALPLAAALALAGCEEPEYAVEGEAVGPGEMIVSEETPGAVPVDVPEAEMTPVPVVTPPADAVVPDEGIAGGATPPAD